MRRVPVLAGILFLLPGVLAAQETAVDTKKEERRQAGRDDGEGWRSSGPRS